MEPSKQMKNSILLESKDNSQFLKSRFGEISQSKEWPPKMVKIPVLGFDSEIPEETVKIK